MRLNQLVAELPKLEAEVDFLKVNKLSANDVVHESATLHERWPSMPTEDKRKVLEALIEKVVIGEKDIDISLNATHPRGDSPGWIAFIVFSEINSERFKSIK